MQKDKIIKELIKENLKNEKDLNYFKRKISKKYNLPFLSNVELLKAYHNLLKNKRIKKSEKIEKLLKIRPVRSLSGIVNVSVLTKPYFCPGKCLYCPKEKGFPKSYLSGEPAAQRAKDLNFDPYLQVKKRLEMLRLAGHDTDKVELRIVGGTWSYYPKNYQIWFITKCFDACNENSKFKIRKSKLKSKIQNLKKSQKQNEKAKHRIVGLSIETRPDFINKKEIVWLRELGVTMVELGIQSIYDNVLQLNQRGHLVKNTILATKLLKDAGFKVLYQMMPNLLGSDLKKDEKMFEELFKNPDFRPDYLKVYPCAVLKEAPLYQLWKKRYYKPYTKEELIELLTKIKKKIPYYVRIQRIIRDISSQKILEGGVKISNLRQILLEKMKKENWRCKCIRCREVKENYSPKEKIYLFRDDYEASEGKEIFLSFENKKRTKLYSLLRLRIPSSLLNKEKHFLPFLENTALIREVRTFGELVPLSVKKIAPQHKGLGKKLIKEAEKIVKKEFHLNKIAVISAVGARDYFRKLNYRLRNTYMIKHL